MRTPLTLLSSSLVLLVAFACSSKRPPAEEHRIPPEERPAGAVADDNKSKRTLADFLRQVPGVVVTGSGANTSVEIQGVGSFYLSTAPLYVVDGQPAGRAYGPVASLVPAEHIDYVRVLKGSEATIYGVKGGNGVILIVTKK